MLEAGKMDEFSVETLAIQFPPQVMLVHKPGETFTAI